MKKFFLSFAVFVMALCANAQTNQYFWYNGNLMMGNPIAQIDSVTFGEGEPADTLHIMLPRTIIKTVHDTVYVTIHDTVCPNEIPSIEASKTEYLWLECNRDFLINWNNDYCNIEYSLDKNNWKTAVPTSVDALETLTQIPANTKVYLRGVNGSTNSFWGSDWWGFMRTTTTDLYNSMVNPWSPDVDDISSIELKAGGNVLSIVFGDSFTEHLNETVYSTLSKIFFWMGMLTDASQLYFAPAAYGTNTGSFHSYGNQACTFQSCYNLKKGPYINYLATGTFAECRSLSDIYYIGDGSEITNDSWFHATAISGSERYITAQSVETLTIHVKPGVTIPYKPTNAVVVEDL